MTKTCPHGHTFDPTTDPPGYKGQCPTCQTLRQIRYMNSPAGKKSKAERQRRYRATAKGKATSARHKLKRVRVAEIHVGYTETPEQADAIMLHIHARHADFNAAQKKERKIFDKTLDKEVEEVLVSNHGKH